jgi:N-methylhydantoinase A
MPISIPVIDMVEIGAGGGSLAHVDSLRQIRVGPESAGSEPGPACYGRGGTRPAVTDADLVLGRLDPDKFAGGRITLKPAASAAALAAHLGDTLDMDSQTAAFGLSEVVDENMANAARVHAVENGEDLSDYTMIAFGGAAPLHAGRLCEKLGITRLLVPSGAGVGSAIGFLRAPFSFEATRSQFMRLADFRSDLATGLLAELTQEATAFVRSCDAKAEIDAQYKVYMRYSGQGWEIPVAFDAALAQSPDAAKFEALFEREYKTLFGRSVAGMDIEITVWSVNATTAAAPATALAPQPAGQRLTATHYRSLFDAASAQMTQAAQWRRADMAIGAELDGPAVIEEEETTIIVPKSRRARAMSDGCIELTARPVDKGAVQ